MSFKYNRYSCLNCLSGTGSTAKFALVKPKVECNYLHLYKIDSRLNEPASYVEGVKNITEKLSLPDCASISFICFERHTGYYIDSLDGKICKEAADIILDDLMREKMAALAPDGELFFKTVANT